MVRHRPLIPTRTLSPIPTPTLTRALNPNSNPDRNPSPNPNPDPNQAKISPYDLHYFSVQTHNTSRTRAAAAAHAPPSECALRLTVLNQTSSEAHKFKLTALFLNRESDKAFFGGWIFRKAMDSKEKDMSKGDGWGASFRKVERERERRGWSRKAAAKGGGRLRKVAKAKGERAVRRAKS